MMLFHIKAKNKFKITKDSTDYQKYLNNYYEGLLTQDYNSNMVFRTKPTEQEVIDALKLLVPTKEYYIGGMEIIYLRDLYPNEL